MKEKNDVCINVTICIYIVRCGIERELFFVIRNVNGRLIALTGPNHSGLLPVISIAGLKIVESSKKINCNFK